MDRRIFISVSFLVCFVLGISVLTTFMYNETTVPVLDQAFVASRPSYEINANYNKKNEEIKGEMTVTMGEQEEPIKEVYFHLYPNAFKKWIYNSASKPSSPGYLNVSNVKVNGSSVKENVQGTVMKIELPKTLKNGEASRIQMNFTLHLPRGGTRLNQFKDTAFLAQWYPMLAVKDKQGWHKDPYTTTGDPFYTQMSNFKVTLGIPKGYNVISSGRDSKQEWNTAKNKVTIEQENVRDFATVITKDYKVVRGKADDVQVNLWYLRGMEDVSKKLHEAATSSMKFFSQRFGKYPYKEIDVVLGETGYGIAGMEYPGLITSVGKVPSREGITPAVNVVAHELAHQWWYGVVGNNQVKEPWLDEGLTTFSEFLYMQDKMNQDEREFLKRAALKTDEINKSTGITSGESLYKYPDEIYGLMVYIRPAAMMYNLIEKIGKEKVLKILNEYYHKYQFQIATGKDFMEVASKVAGQDLTPFFNKWLYFK